MERWRKIFFTALLVLLAGSMVYITVDMFSDLSEATFQRWLKFMIGGTAGVLGCLYKIMGTGEWAQKHPLGARIADICGWIGVVFSLVWAVIYWIL